MAKIKGQYTVILTNYNGEQYIFDALDSIFIQDYPNIQLIITDDASTSFNQLSIEKYIARHKRENIKNVQILANKKNLGTVKTLNNALKKATGEFVLFFASDDQLADRCVLSNFCSAFKNKRKEIVTSQWIICDQNLKSIKNYINPIEAWYFNLAASKQQFFRLCKSNLYGAGATSYRMTVFEKYGFFDEKYRLLEDWPFWLRISWNKGKLFYKNFNGLYHRSGGISESTNKLSLNKKEFYNEILQTFRMEILPRLQSFPSFKRIEILKSYKDQINILNGKLDLEKDFKTFEKALIDNHLKLWWKLDKLNPHIFQKLKILWKFNKEVSFTILLSVLFSFIYVNQNSDSNNDLILFVCLLGFLLIYIGMCWIVKLYKLKKERSR